MKPKNKQKNKLNKVIEFIKLTNMFREVERSIYIPNRETNENDAEHSYQLAMLAWYLLSTEDYGLDKDLAIKYALVHDFVEVYAGDVWFFRSKDESKLKAQRERNSALRLKKEIPEFSDFHELIGNYEKRTDRESRFVYALDKLIPILNVYLDDGKLWKDKKITLTHLVNTKTSKIAISPEIKPYFEQLVELLGKKKHMFHVEQE